MKEFITTEETFSHFTDEDHRIANAKYRHMGIRNAMVKRRKEKEWTQQKLAEESGIARTSIAKIESGKRYMSTIIMFKILNALELEVKLSPTTPNGKEK